MYCIELYKRLILLAVFETCGPIIFDQYFKMHLTQPSITV